MSVGDRGSKVESHVVWLFKFEPPMCSVHHTADWARACPATRAASCSAADCGRTASGRVRLASARSCVPLGMRSITTGVSHLRSRSFLGPPGTYASVGCSRLRRRIRGALPLSACPCWPTLIRRPEVPCASEIKGVRSTVHIKPRPNRRHCAVCPSV